MTEIRTKFCKRIYFEKQSNGNSYKKVVKQEPCPDKPRCKDGQLAKPTKDGRVYCKHDREG